MEIHNETVVFRQAVPVFELGEIISAEATYDGDTFSIDESDDGVVYARQTGSSTKTEFRDEHGQPFDRTKRYDVVRVTVESLTGQPKTVLTLEAFIKVMRCLYHGANNLRDVDRSVSTN